MGGDSHMTQLLQQSQAAAVAGLSQWAPPPAPGDPTPNDLLYYTPCDNYTEVITLKTLLMHPLTYTLMHL